MSTSKKHMCNRVKYTRLGLVGVAPPYLSSPHNNRKAENTQVKKRQESSRRQEHTHIVRERGRLNGESESNILLISRNSQVEHRRQLGGQRLLQIMVPQSFSTQTQIYSSHLCTLGHRVPIRQHCSP